MFHFLEYPFSRGSTHIKSPSPYDAPKFDAGFMSKLPSATYSPLPIPPAHSVHHTPHDPPRYLTNPCHSDDKRDMAPMVWGYIKSRETARRMDAYAGEVTNMHPFYAYNSPARALDMDMETRNAYAGPNHISANIQHGEPYPLITAPSGNYATVGVLLCDDVMM